MTGQAQPSRPLEEARGAHVAVVTIPQPGHVLPTLAVVSELVLRGHRVTFVASEEFAVPVLEAGADVFLPLVSRPPVGAIPDGDLEAGIVLLARQACELVPRLLDVFTRDRPDVILHDLLAWAGQVVADRIGVPAVQLNCSHAPYAGWESEMCGVSSLRQTEFYEVIRSLLSGNGVRGGVESFLTEPSSSVVFTVESFQRRLETVGEVHTFVGPALGPRNFQGDWHPPSDGRPLLAIAMGSSPGVSGSFVETCLEAFEPVSWDVVMAVGDQPGPRTVSAVPKNIHIMHSIPQLRVLSQAGAFVSHGGMGSIMEAVYHGVPLVVIPRMAEQMVNARQVERLGLGRRLPPRDLTPKTLREAFLDVVGDGRIAAQVRNMQLEARAAGGARAAADVVERAVRSVRPSLPHAGAPCGAVSGEPHGAVPPSEPLPRAH
ncbi:macrolide family glycosyltransferase [Streptomyces sp. NPDC054834]